ncbi:hypothetical protein [Streptomyces sp. B93]|uniref:hypothetical protein n=1 Tax=Streptomyces sp. B93 TaxID=2824875 RepID=UPI001B375BD7|nr:hypothetical protein [Streptomyces sp. B93]MBQ1088859.1 hypothetical protein [Streptomyces sp. B93]
MGVRDVLRRTALARPAVLLVPLPGATAVRLAAEAELRRRGWPRALSPAAADLLVVAGDARGTGGDPLDAVWRQLSWPRARVDLPGTDGLAHRLDTAAARLTSSQVPEDDDPDDHGLPMADRADDRDGLRLDRLHVPFGPALPDWPCGLVLRTALQGDVVQDVEVDRLPVPAGSGSYWNGPWLRAARGAEVTRGEAERRRCAAHLDSLGRFLAVAGWRDAAARARRLRDTAPADGSHRAEVLRLVRRVSRSRTLRWLTAGVGPLPAARARHLGVSGPALAAGGDVPDRVGDVHDRVRVWLDEVARAVAAFEDRTPLTAADTDGPRGRVDGPRPPSAALLDALPELLRGAEFGAARLIVASLDPDVDELAAVPAREVPYG